MDDKQVSPPIAIPRREAYLCGIEIIGILDHLHEALQRLHIEPGGRFGCRPECSFHRTRRMAQGMRQRINRRLREGWCAWVCDLA